MILAISERLFLFPVRSASRSNNVACCFSGIEIGIDRVPIDIARLVEGLLVFAGAVFSGIFRLERLLALAVLTDMFDSGLLPHLYRIYYRYSTNVVTITPDL